MSVSHTVGKVRTSHLARLSSLVALGGFEPAQREVQSPDVCRLHHSAGAVCEDENAEREPEDLTLGVYFLGYTVCTTPLKLVNALPHFAPARKPKDDVPDSGFGTFAPILHSTLNYSAEHHLSIDPHRSSVYQFLEDFLDCLGKGVSHNGLAQILPRRSDWCLPAQDFIEDSFLATQFSKFGFQQLSYFLPTLLDVGITRLLCQQYPQRSQIVLHGGIASQIDISTRIIAPH